MNYDVIVEREHVLEAFIVERESVDEVKVKANEDDDEDDASYDDDDGLSDFTNSDELTVRSFLPDDTDTEDDDTTGSNGETKLQPIQMSLSRLPYRLRFFSI